MRAVAPRDNEGYDPLDDEDKFYEEKRDKMTTSVGSTMEQYREQGWENMVTNGLIDPTENWGVAVADEDYDPAKSLGQDPT